MGLFSLSSPFPLLLVVLLLLTPGLSNLHRSDASGLGSLQWPGEFIAFLEILLSSILDGEEAPLLSLGGVLLSIGVSVVAISGALLVGVSSGVAMGITSCSSRSSRTANLFVVSFLGGLGADYCSAGCGVFFWGLLCFVGSWVNPSLSVVG